MVIIVIILGVDSLLEINIIYKQCFPAVLQYNDVLCYVWNLNISVCVFKYIFMQMHLWCHLFMAPVLASPTIVNKDWNNNSKTFCTCPHDSVVQACIIANLSQFLSDHSFNIRQDT